MAKNDTLQDVLFHYNEWTDDMETRKTQEDGWDDIVDAYWGKLPDNWPYLSQVVDPVITTSLIEKRARLTNSKLRGRLVPREGADVLKARLNNALLDFQWDNANYLGFMNDKWGNMDTDARSFGSSFALILWRQEYDDEDKLVYKGNDMLPILPYNVGLDPACSHVRDARWVQIRRWQTIEELEDISDTPGEAKFPGLSEFKKKVEQSKKSDARDAEYTSRTLANRGLEDRVGYDKTFPVYEIVTEYRKDRWITFSPKHKIVLRDIKNPYKHRSIPIIQLRYHPLIDDPWGQSEVRRVLPLWRSIQSVLNGYLDDMNIKMRPPLKVLEGQVRMETIEYSPDAMWLMSQLDAVQEYSGSGESLRYFQTTYSALKSAFSQAMGDLSQGVSNVDPNEADKTATEIRAISKQQNVRDQNNQIYLADTIKDMMRMWLSNNQQFLFNKKHGEYILNIVGKNNFRYFKESGLADEVPDPQAVDEAVSMIKDNPEAFGDFDIEQMYKATQVPKYPIVDNPNAQPEDMKVKSKLRISDREDSAEVSLTPDDLNGTYDYIPDVKSMAAGSNQEMIQTRQQAINNLTQNQGIIQALQQQGYMPNIKEMYIDQLEDTGMKDAERYFEEVKQPDAAATGQAGSLGAPQQPAGVPAIPEAVASIPNQQQMAGPAPI
jgi:hypothetical protein